MRKFKYFLSLFVATVLLVGCNETLEETYGDVTDGGKIRYVAKCSDLRANPGWERLLVTWKNGTDATIEKIKLVWVYNGISDSVLLEPLTSSYELKKLVNAVYRFDIIAMDKEGNTSLNETTYGRPYTREHEIMNAFTRGVVKSYFVNNKMIFFADKWNPNILDIRLKYKNSNGEPKEYIFDKETTYGNLITIDDVSMNHADEVIVLRKGKFEDSLDEIDFDPLAISRMKIYSSGFIHYIERTFGLKNNTIEEKAEFEKFIEGVTELEFDQNVETFEDVLHCPKLEKLIFGKNRFISSNYVYTHRSLITGDEQKSRIVVEKAIELFGLKIEYYGLVNKPTQEIPHYFRPAIPSTKFVGTPKLPTELVAIGKEDYNKFEDGELVSCNPIDPYAVLEDLLDNDYETRWETISTQHLKRYNLLMELKVETEVQGVKIAQPMYPASDKRTPFFTPRNITIQTSLDGAVWDNVTYFEENALGRSSGEVTYLKFPEGRRKIKYVKVALQDGVDYASNCMISLGDIVLLK